MKKRIKAPSFVTILVLSVITIAFWIGFELFRTLTIKPDQPVPREITLPLNPVLDLEALSELQKRIYLTDSQIGDTVLEPIVPIETEAPEATTEVEETPLPEETPEAAAEGEVVVEESPVLTEEAEETNE